MLDISILSEAISAEQPSGPNLEYEPGFIEMELAAQYGEEQQVGDVLVEAAPPDFAALSAAALAVLKSSHDLRAAVFLTEAELAREGLAGFATGVALIAGYLERFWDSCHPQPDEDDGDVTMRINAVAGLADRARMIALLRRAPLTDSRAFGRMALRDIEIADGRLPPPETGPVADINTLSAAFRDSDEDQLGAMRGALAEARRSVAAIEASFSERTPGEGPALDPLTDTLRAIDQAFARFLGASAPASDGAVEAPQGAAAGAGAPRVAAGGAPGAINGPDDVVAALNAIASYYRTHEPSSPVPILLERAKRLVRADFLTIIRDMASDGMDEVRRIGGLPDDDD